MLKDLQVPEAARRGRRGQREPCRPPPGTKEEEEDHLESRSYETSCWM